MYAWPLARGGNEGAPTVEADADADASSYPADKRGAELALTRELGDERVILARAGLILGPRENVGRLPWWLRRIALGGEFLAPGPSDLPLQYIDSRDLAMFCMDAAAAGRSGPVDAVSRPGATTMGAIIAACQRATQADAVPLWIDGDWLISQGVEPWTELPIWIPASSESYCLHDGDTSRAARWGLRTRPIEDTVQDTWAWLESTKEPLVLNAHSTAGLDPARESELRSLWRSR